MRVSAVAVKEPLELAWLVFSLLEKMGEGESGESGSSLEVLADL